MLRKKNKRGLKRKNLKRMISAAMSAVMLAAVTASFPCAAQAEENAAPEIPGLTYESVLEKKFAEGYDIYYYEDDYELIDIHDDARYLLVPENGGVPEGLDGDIVVIQKPLENIYLAASATMALFDAIGSIDAIRLSALQQSGWYIEDAVQAMENGDMLFAGKYSEPDYELLINENCDLAIESTMILHSPKVQEMIEQMDIPVFVDRSSYETHPLGRTEWVKVYGAMLDKDEEAAAFFDEQAKVITDLGDVENTGKTVAFFYVNSSDSVVVRRSTDYVPKMIEIAGGEYVFSGVDEGDDSKKSSLPVTMEQFYATAVDADYLVYNGTIDNPIESIDELLAKSELFAEFKAVKEGNVWCADKYLYQATDIVGNLIMDLHLMLTGGDEEQMTFLKKIS